MRRVVGLKLGVCAVQNAAKSEKSCQEGLDAASISASLGRHSQNAQPRPLWGKRDIEPAWPKFRV